MGSQVGTESIPNVTNRPVPSKTHSWHLNCAVQNIPNWKPTQSTPAQTLNSHPQLLRASQNLSQNAPNACPPKHKPTQRLTNHTPTKPDIPPSAFPQHEPALPSPLLHAHNATFHPNLPLDLAAVAAGEEGAGAGAGGAASEDGVEEEGY